MNPKQRLCCIAVLAVSILPPDLFKRKYVPAKITETYGGGSVSTTFSKVNPENVGFIKAIAFHQFRILFKDIPLDPKQ